MNFTKRTYGLLLALLLMMAMVLSACGGAGNPAAEAPAGEAAGDQQTSALERIQASGKLRLGTSADYPPFEFHKIVDGKDTIMGFDIDIAREIAADLGVELVITDMGFDGLLTALQTGNLDMVISGVTADEDRAKSVDFSMNYYTAVQKVIIRGEDAETYKTVADLAGQKVGAQLGTVQEDIVQEQMPDSEMRSLTKLPDLILDLKSKNIAAVVVEEPIAEAYVGANPELIVSDIELVQDDAGYSVAMPKDSPELVEAVNATLQRLLDAGKIDEFVTEATNAMENSAE